MKGGPPTRGGGGEGGGGGGRGGRSNIKMPGCVCFVPENRLILNETLSCKHTHIEGVNLMYSYPFSIVILSLKD